MFHCPFPINGLTCALLYGSIISEVERLRAPRAKIVLLYSSFVILPKLCAAQLFELFHQASNKLNDPDLDRLTLNRSK